MSEYQILCVPCPDCNTDTHISYLMEDLPAGALRTYCKCDKCGLRAAGAILTAGAIARSPDTDIIDNTAAENWNKMVARLRERGEI